MSKGSKRRVQKIKNAEMSLREDLWRAKEEDKPALLVELKKLLELKT